MPEVACQLIGQCVAVALRRFKTVIVQFPVLADNVRKGDAVVGRGTRGPLSAPPLGEYFYLGARLLTIYIIILSVLGHSTKGGAGRGHLITLIPNMVGCFWAYWNRVMGSRTTFL